MQNNEHGPRSERGMQCFLSARIECLLLASIRIKGRMALACTAYSRGLLRYASKWNIEAPIRRGIPTINTAWFSNKAHLLTWRRLSNAL